MSDMNKKTVTITDENFKELVLENSDLVLIDFWASWCAPCKMLSPIIDSVANECENLPVTISKMSVEENSTIPMEFGIRNIPALLYFKDGKVVDKSVGAVPKTTIMDKINSLL